MTTHYLPRYVSAPLASLAQIFFLPHARTGLFILIGLVSVNPRLAVFVLAGAILSCVLAALAGEGNDVWEGMSGYNGALVGGAAELFAPSTIRAVVGLILGCVGALVLRRLLGAIFQGRALARFALPVSTAPFCIAGTVFFYTWPPHPSSPGRPQPAEPSAVIAMLKGVAESFSQDIFDGHVLAGVLIFIGILIGQRTLALYGLLGAIVGLCTSLLLHPMAELATGVYSYCPALAAMGIACADRAEWSRLSRTLWAVGAAVVAVVIQALMAHSVGLHLPTLTWPFVLSLWLALVLSRALPWGSPAAVVQHGKNPRA